MTFKSINGSETDGCEGGLSCGESQDARRAKVGVCAVGQPNRASGLHIGALGRRCAQMHGWSALDARVLRGSQAGGGENRNSG